AGARAGPHRRLDRHRGRRRGRAGGGRRAGMAASPRGKWGNPQAPARSAATLIGYVNRPIRRIATKCSIGTGADNPRVASVKHFKRPTESTGAGIENGYTSAYSAMAPALDPAVGVDRSPISIQH